MTEGLHGDGRGGVVRVGSSARIRSASGDEDDMMIVGRREEQGIGRLHVGCALGAALLGHRKGDEVTVRTDAGTVTFTIVDVRP